MLSRSSRTQNETKQTKTQTKQRETQKQTKTKQNQAPSNDVTGTSLWVKKMD